MRQVHPFLTTDAGLTPFATTPGLATGLSLAYCPTICENIVLCVPQPYTFPFLFPML